MRTGEKHGLSWFNMVLASVRRVNYKKKGRGRIPGRILLY